MYEQHVIVTTKHGRMPAFVACPDGPGPFPPIIFYMDAPGTREELEASWCGQRSAGARRAGIPDTG